jgi:hypothetical protein
VLKGYLLTRLRRRFLKECQKELLPLRWLLLLSWLLNGLLMGLLFIWVLKGYLLTRLRMELLLRRRFLKECQKELLPLRWLLLLR